MAISASSLSIVCKHVFDFIGTGLGASVNNIAMTLGAPGEEAEDTGINRINLFFYRFEPGGFDAMSHPQEPWHMRIFCLITTFGVGDTDVSAGEYELRMLGEVIRLFRETPVLSAVTSETEEVRLQAVFTPVSDEQINQIWSTQGDVNYRPSVVYELALVPIVPLARRAQPPRVGALGMEARAGQSARFAHFSGAIQGPPVRRQQVNSDDPQWLPLLSWVHNGQCAHSLALDITSPEFAAFASEIWLAGDPGESVELQWEIWDNAGWRSAGPAVSVQVFNGEIDPANVPPAAVGFPLAVANPVVIPPDQNAAQGMLYATRDVVLSPGQPPVRLRSNPLLLSLYRPAP